MTAIKICGITEEAGLQTALALRVQRIGLMFAPNSPRLINLDTACQLAETARTKTALVAVMVNPGDKMVSRIASQLRPDFFQLHGRETPERVRAIWKRFHIPVIKAFAITSLKDISDAERYQRTAAEFLFDAKPPQGADRAGGYGTRFNWEFLAQTKPSRPWLLAGGLTPDTVGAALAITHAPMVDVSSGVERQAGVKDATLLRKFCENVRNSGQNNGQT